MNGEPITIQEFQRKYEQLEQQVRAQYPDLDAAGLKAMQLKQQLIQNLILENLIMQEAKRVGIVVTPVELRKLIESFPAFHNAEGKFDPDAYVRVIKAQRNTPGNFEAELRNNMLMNKLRADVTAGAFVPEAEVRDLFRYEGERRILEYVFYPLEDYTSKVTVDDAQIKDYYEPIRHPSPCPRRPTWNTCSSARKRWPPPRTSATPPYPSTMKRTPPSSPPPKWCAPATSSS